MDERVFASARRADFEIIPVAPGHVRVERYADLVLREDRSVARHGAHDDLVGLAVVAIDAEIDVVRIIEDS